MFPRGLRASEVLLALVLGLSACGLWAQEKVGVLLLHGKSPGSNSDPSMRSLMHRLERDGMEAVFPQMPWSRTRYLDGNWDGAMREMQEHVAGLRAKGATRIVIVGHSMGSPAALSYAARHGGVDALVLFAPGHVPRSYYSSTKLVTVRQSIDEARAMLAAGKGEEVANFNDINQGRAQNVRMKAVDYLSFFDPGSDAEMGVTAPRVPADVAVLTVIGNSDPLFSRVRDYFHDKLPHNPKTQLLEVTATHLTTPEVATPQAIEWIKQVTAARKP